MIRTLTKSQIEQRANYAAIATSSSVLGLKPMLIEFAELIQAELVSLNIATDEVKELMAKGRKIDAIKVYRSFTGVSLIEAKTFVEKYETKAPGGVQAPEQGRTGTGVPSPRQIIYSETRDYEGDRP